MSSALLLDRMLRNAGISPRQADTQLTQRAQWQMSSYLNVACKRLQHSTREAQDTITARRDEQVAALLERLHETRRS